MRPLLILIVGAIAFSNALRAPLVMDDHVSIADNPSIRTLASLDVFMPEREQPVAGRPLANLTLAINYAMAGQAVEAYHLTNLLFHLLCAVVAFRLLELMLRLKAMPEDIQAHASAIALAAALIWVVHPVNTEVVNYLTQRTESLMALFYLLTLYGAARALDAGGRGWTIFAVGSCVIGALCKETIVTAPVAVAMFDRLLVYDSWRDAWRARRSLYMGLLVSWLVIAGLQATDPRPLSAGFSSGLSPWTYLMNQAVMITRYASLAVWPRDLVVLYGIARPLSLGDVLPQVLLIACALIGTVVAWRRWPVLGAAGGWIFLTLAPTSSILPIATEVGAERRMYLPLLAVTAVAASTLWRLSPVPSVRTGITALVVIVLSALTLVRNNEYASGLRLAEVTLERHPTGFAHLLVAEELLRAGRREEALGHLRTSVADTPRAHYTLGVELMRGGRFDEAVTEFKAFIEREPLLREVPDAEARVARALALKQQWTEALRYARQALDKQPNNADAQFVIADAALANGGFAVAIEGFRRYLAARPNDADAATKLGLALTSSGEVDAGIDMFRRAADLDPSNWRTRRNLALALLDVNRPAESVMEARRTLTINPNDAFTYTLLGQGLLRTGQRDAAAAAFERALLLDPADEDARRYLNEARQG